MRVCMRYRNADATSEDADVCYRINRQRVGSRVCTCPHDINRPTRMRCVVTQHENSLI